MTRQTVSVEFAIQQGNLLLAQGNTTAAQQIYSQILNQFPDLQAPRIALKSILNHQVDEVTTTGINRSVDALKHTSYFKQEAVKGWAYTLVIDHHYIHGDFQKLDNSRQHKAKNDGTFDKDEITPGYDPGLYFPLIKQIRDLHERFAYLNELTQEKTRSILADSFDETASEDMENEVRQVFSQQAMNVVILGAGLTGLALANMLKNTFKDKINILLLENRVFAQHYKKPYSRNWLTNIPLSLLLGVMDKELTDVLGSLGTNGYIGAPINIFETLMLLSCKTLGVKFLFRKSADISFLKEADLDMVFDATGNRYKEISLDTFPDEQINTINADLVAGRQLAKNYARFGVTTEPCQDIQNINLLAAENLLVPVYKQEPIKTAMIKVTGIPIAFFEGLFSSIQHANGDNRFYLWPGTLQNEINQALLIVNLTPPEFEALQSYILAPISIETFLANFEDWDILDKRFIDVLQKIAREVPTEYDVRLEPPFLYEPYMLGYPQQWEKVNGAPLIRIGDSIYNGHVKCGNGIGSHLMHIRYIHDALLKGQLFYQ